MALLGVGKKYKKDERLNSLSGSLDTDGVRLLDLLLQRINDGKNCENYT